MINSKVEVLDLTNDSEDEGMTCSDVKMSGKRKRDGNEETIDDNSDKWTCKKCTLLNAKSSTSCGVCGTSKQEEDPPKKKAKKQSPMLDFDTGASSTKKSSYRKKKNRTSTSTTSFFTGKENSGNGTPSPKKKTSLFGGGAAASKPGSLAALKQNAEELGIETSGAEKGHLETAIEERMKTLRSQVRKVLKGANALESRTSDIDYALAKTKYDAKYAAECIMQNELSNSIARKVSLSPALGYVPKAMSKEAKGSSKSKASANVGQMKEDKSTSTNTNQSVSANGSDNGTLPVGMRVIVVDPDSEYYGTTARLVTERPGWWGLEGLDDKTMIRPKSCVFLYEGNLEQLKKLNAVYAKRKRRSGTPMPDVVQWQEGAGGKQKKLVKLELNGNKNGVVFGKFNTQLILALIPTPALKSAEDDEAGDEESASTSKPSGDRSDATPQKALRVATTQNRIEVSVKQQYYHPSDFDGLCSQVDPDSSKSKMTVNVFRYGRTSPNTTDQNNGLGQVMSVTSCESILEEEFDDVCFKYHSEFIMAQETSKYCSFDDSSLQVSSSAGNYADESPGLDALVDAIELCPHDEIAVVLVTEMTRVCLTDMGYRQISDRIRGAHPSGKDFVAIYSLSAFGLDDEDNEKLCKCRTILEEKRRDIAAEYSQRYPQKSFTRTEAAEKEQNKILEDAKILKSCLLDVHSDEYDKAIDAVKRGTDISDEEAMASLQKFINVYDNNGLSMEQKVIELEKLKKKNDEKSPKYDVILCRMSPGTSTKTHALLLPGTDTVPLHQLSLGMTHANHTIMAVVTDEKWRRSWRTNLALGRAWHMYFNDELGSMKASNPTRVAIEHGVIDLTQRCMPIDWRECQGLKGVEVILAEGKRQDELTDCIEKYNLDVEKLLKNSRSEVIQAIGKELKCAASSIFNPDQSKDIPVVRSSLRIHPPSIKSEGANPDFHEPPTMLHDLKPDPVVRPNHPNVARLDGVQFTPEAEGLIKSVRTKNIIQWEETMAEGERSMALYLSQQKSLPEGTEEAEVNELKNKIIAARSRKNRNKKNIDGADAYAVVKVCAALVEKETAPAKKDALNKLIKNLGEDTAIARKGTKYSSKPKKDNQHDSEGCKAANVSFTRWTSDLKTNKKKNMKKSIEVQLSRAKKEYYACKSYDSLKLARDGTDCNNPLGAELIKHLTKRLDEKTRNINVKVYGGKTKYHHTAKALSKIQSMSIVAYA